MGASSLESLWGTPSRPPSCPVATDCPTALGNCPTAMAPEEWQVQGARPATRQAQELVPRLQRQPKQLSMVLREPESSPELAWAVSPVSVWAAFLGQFLGSEALQGPELPLLLLPLQPQRQPSMGLLEA